MNPERQRILTDSFAQVLATISTISTQLHIRNGKHVAQTDFAPPKGRDDGTCQGCEKPAHGRVFCSACRKTSSVELGPPLVDVMFRSSRSEFELRPGSLRLAQLVGLHNEKVHAETVLRIVKKLASWCFIVHNDWQKNGNDGNVLFSLDFVNECGTYAVAIPCSVGSRRGPLLVGGLGVQIHDAVKQLAIEWLVALDAAFRNEFGIPLQRETGDMSFMVNVTTFATLIANRVALMENPDVHNPSQRLCTVACEFLAEIQITRCKYGAASGVRADVVAMRHLSKVATRISTDPGAGAGAGVGAGAGAVLADAEARQLLLRLLHSPPPELLSALPTVAVDMKFAQLRDAIGLFDTEHAASLQSLELWRNNVATQYLGDVLAEAIAAAQQWEPRFLQCLQPSRSGTKENRSVPTMHWADSPNHAMGWNIIPACQHLKRRHGLDPTGLRIVLLSAAITQLMASTTPQFFLPGAVRSDVLWRVVTPVAESTAFVVSALRDQMRPLVIGIEWMQSRKCLTDWQNSHFDATIRRALSQLGGFSYEEVMNTFMDSTETWCEVCGAKCASNTRCPTPGCRGAPQTQSSTSSKVQTLLFEKVTPLMLPIKPQKNYQDWIRLSVKLALPMLLELRQNLGFGHSVRTNPIGDVLRLFSQVRTWSPRSGDLQLSQTDVSEVPSAKKLLLEASTTNGQRLVKFRRVGTRNVWIFDKWELEKLLKPY